MRSADKQTDTHFLKSSSLTHSHTHLWRRTNPVEKHQKAQQTPPNASPKISRNTPPEAARIERKAPQAAVQQANLQPWATTRAINSSRKRRCNQSSCVEEKYTVRAGDDGTQHQRRRRRRRSRGNKHGKLLTIWRGTRRLVESSHWAIIFRCPSRSAVSTGSCPRRNRQWIVSWRHSYKYLECDEWAECEA